MEILYGLTRAVPLWMIFSPYRPLTLPTERETDKEFHQTHKKHMHQDQDTSWQGNRITEQHYNPIPKDRKL